MGVNLPPIHPNCRCTIGSYVLEDNGISIDFMKFLSKLSNLGIAGTSTLLYNQDWYRNLLLGFIKQVEPIAVKDKNYVRLPDFQMNIFINNNKIYNSSEEDNRLLSLMKKRDSIGLTDEEYKEAIRLMHNPNSTVKFFEPYSYYIVGRDVTDEVDKIIDDIKLEYSHLVGAGLKSMPTFRKLVTGNSRLDLKNRTPYKTNSTYLYKGKLVDADYLGNFVYGHIGRVFGIEEVILFSAAGYKQRVDGTSSSEFYRTYYDDPKDQEAILEGIYYYEKMQDSTKTE